MKKSSIIILSILAGVAVVVLGQRFVRNNFNLPQEGEIKKDGEIMVTDGTKHSVPLDEIIGGGPPKDGIPSIDHPKFVSVQDASKQLSDKEPGIALDINGIARFYPFQILVWHEIVNDTIPASAEASAGKNGQRVLVTYCPLCLSGIVFDPLVNGERVEFGTSGKLWNSNLVMYDRKTNSLWSQILGEAIVGEKTGTRLAVLQSDQIRFGEWKRLHPTGEVLSQDTGTTRFYGQDPYGDYYTTPGTYFPVGKKDDRLSDKDFVLGIVVNGKAKAYWLEAIKKLGEVEDRFQDKTIVAQYEKDIDAVRLFSAEGGSASGGEKKLVRINPFGSFWFSWVAAHPETELFK
ncbi:MAG: DUF3179 domain-containing protein [Candidatus Liptonbacteria bacterium]|nr:DUF3179 domain-containing protein [Candidatus Liptonbacteria bacterium]